MTKVKLYKNPDRANPTSYKPYVPAYEVHGISPIEISPATVPAVQTQLTRHSPVVSRNSPRIRPAQVFRKNVPFADVPTTESPVGKGPLPNIGNNVETNWVSVDGDDFDDVFIDKEGNQLHIHKATLEPDRPMIDNNLDDPNNYQDIPEEVPPPPENRPTYIVDEPEEEKEVEALNIGADDYVLIVSGNILSIGNLDIVQEEVKALCFGEHALNRTNDITLDDIIVLKRVKLKVGVFLE